MTETIFTQKRSERVSGFFNKFFYLLVTSQTYSSALFSSTMRKHSTMHFRRVKTRKIASQRSKDSDGQIRSTRKLNSLVHTSDKHISLAVSHTNVVNIRISQSAYKNVDLSTDNIIFILLSRCNSSVMVIKLI